MPGTFKKIDYRLRPAKHAERVMLVDLFRRMRFAPIETYQYIGFGSVAFVDFRMVHKELGIKGLVSIEVISAKLRAWMHYFLAPARGSQIQAMCEPTGRP